MSAASQPIKIKSHRDLIVWQKAMVLVTEVYGLTNLNLEQHTAEKAKLDAVGRLLNGLMRSITSDS